MAEELADFLAVDGRPVRIVERSAQPSAFVTRLAALAPWLEVLRAAPTHEHPRLVVEGSRPQGEITFVGTIEGRVAEALAILVRALATGDPGYDTPATPQLLGTLDRKLGVGVHVKATCPYCPSVMAAVLRFPQATPWIDAVVVRADEVTDPRVRSVPTVIANGQLVSAGSIAEFELAERVLDVA
ncbi:MAG: thioredoxin family protein [Myxococcales bacterium]|nr:thioredoxin family protein [Myxococcales bacterium]